MGGCWGKFQLSGQESSPADPAGSAIGWGVGLGEAIGPTAGQQSRGWCCKEGSSKQATLELASTAQAAFLSINQLGRGDFPTLATETVVIIANCN